MNTSVLWTLLTVAFAAGGAWILLKQSRKDVNGLGRKMNREISDSLSRHQNVTLALMLLAKDDIERRTIAMLLREERRLE